MDRESAKTLAQQLLEELKSEDPDSQKLLDMSSTLQVWVEEQQKLAELEERG